MKLVRFKKYYYGRCPECRVEVERIGTVERIGSRYGLKNITRCPKCGKEAEVGLYGKCPKCETDLEKGAHWDGFTNDGRFRISGLSLDCQKCGIEYFHDLNPKQYHYFAFRRWISRPKISILKELLGRDKKTYSYYIADTSKEGIISYFRKLFDRSGITFMVEQVPPDKAVGLLEHEIKWQRTELFELEHSGKIVPEHLKQKHDDPRKPYEVEESARRLLEIINSEIYGLYTMRVTIDTSVVGKKTSTDIIKKANELVGEKIELSGVCSREIKQQLRGER